MVSKGRAAAAARDVLARKATLSGRLGTPLYSKSLGLAYVGAGRFTYFSASYLRGEWTGPGPAGSPDAALGEAAIPEPSSLLLALLATLGLSFYRRRDRAFQAPLIPDVF